MYDVLTINYNTNSLTNACIQSLLCKHDENLRTIYVLDNSDKIQLELNCHTDNIQVIDNYNGKIFKKSDVVAQYGKTETDTNFGSMHHAYSVDWFMYAFQQTSNLVLIDSDAILKKKIDFINENLCTIAKLQDSRIYWKDKGMLRFEPTLQYINTEIVRKNNIHYFDPSRIHGGFRDDRLYDTGGSFFEDVVVNGLPFGQINTDDYVSHLVNGSWKEVDVDKFIDDNKMFMT